MQKLRFSLLFLCALLQGCIVFEADALKKENGRLKNELEINREKMAGLRASSKNQEESLRSENMVLRKNLKELGDENRRLCSLRKTLKELRDENRRLCSSLCEFIDSGELDFVKALKLYCNASDLMSLQEAHSAFEYFEAKFPNSKLRMNSMEFRKKLAAEIELLSPTDGTPKPEKISVNQLAALYAEKGEAAFFSKNSKGEVVPKRFDIEGYVRVVNLDIKNSFFTMSDNLFGEHIRVNYKYTDSITKGYFTNNFYGRRCVRVIGFVEAVGVYLVVRAEKIFTDYSDY